MNDWHGASIWAVNGASIGALITAFFGIFPPILAIAGALAALVYYVLQIIDHPRVEAWRKARASRKLAKRVSELQMRQAAIVGELKKLGVLAHADTTVESDKTVHSITTIETNSPKI